jgi:hypothetical protein
MPKVAEKLHQPFYEMAKRLENTHKNRPPHYLTSRKRRSNGVVLRMRQEKPRPGVTGVAR